MAPSNSPARAASGPSTELVTLICGVCGKTFRCKRETLERRHRQGKGDPFCSADCTELGIERRLPRRATSLPSSPPASLPISGAPITPAPATAHQDAVAPCGWHGTLRAFLAADQSAWLAALADHHTRCMGMAADTGQRAAWVSSFAVLRDQLAGLVAARPAAAAWTLVFEYELPRERGRRPDVVILAGGDIVVLEFKDFSSPLAAHRDQVAAYARDLAHYHAASHGHPVTPALVLTRSTAPTEAWDGVAVVGKTGLAPLLMAIGQSTAPALDPATWRPAAPPAATTAGSTPATAARAIAPPAARVRLCRQAKPTPPLPSAYLRSSPMARRPTATGWACPGRR